MNETALELASLFHRNFMEWHRKVVALVWVYAMENWYCIQMEIVS